MFIVKIQGRLGNQLGQYAFGKYLEKTYSKKVVYDTSSFRRQSKRDFLLHKVLKHKVRTVNTSSFSWQRKLKKFSTFREIQKFTFDKRIQNVEDNTIFDGDFCHHKYLEPIKEILRQSLRPYKIAKKYRTMRESHALIALHIRRGDYIADETTCGFHDHCSLSYYTQALEEMQKKVNVLCALFLAMT